MLPACRVLPVDRSHSSVALVSSLPCSKIQEESLRTYIFAYSEVYDCLSLQCLVDMFELPLQVVHSLVSKMIFKEELKVCHSVQ